MTVADAAAAAITASCHVLRSVKLNTDRNVKPNVAPTRSAKSLARSFMAISQSLDTLGGHLVDDARGGEEKGVLQPLDVVDGSVVHLPGLWTRQRALNVFDRLSLVHLVG